MLAALLLLAVPPGQDPLPALDLRPRVGSGETVLVAIPDASDTGRALVELLASLAPLDEALDLRRRVLAAGSKEAAQFRAEWDVGGGPLVAILDRAEGPPVATFGADEFGRAFLDSVVRPRLAATLPPEGVGFRDGGFGVAVLVAWETTETVGEMSRLELTARWIGPDPRPAPGRPHRPLSETCDVPAGLKLDRPRVRLAPSAPAGTRPVPDLLFLADATGPAPEPVRAELAIDGAVFDPWTLVVPAGSTVRFVNRDRCGHAVHLHARRNAALNSTVAPEGQVEHRFDRPEVVRVVDDLHPWMEAWVVVTESPHVVATGVDGRAVLEAPPVGVSGLRLWHPDRCIRLPGLPVEVLPGDDMHVRVWMFGM